MTDDPDDIRQRVALQTALMDHTIGALGRATEAMVDAAAGAREMATALAAHRAASDAQHAATQAKIDGLQATTVATVTEAKGKHELMEGSFTGLRAEVAGLRADLAAERKAAREDRATLWRMAERALPYIIGALGAGGGLYGWHASSTPPTTPAADHAAP